MIRVMIVDDEQHARDELASLLNEVAQVDIVASCANALEAVKLINKLHPEVLFLDIQMPVIDGFELLSLLDQEVMPQVVFVTAYDQYALKAFEEKTLDYLLKPIDPERLKKTMAKIEAAIDTGEEPHYQTPELTRIPCASGHKIKLIDPKQVEYIHSDLSGVHVFTAEGNFFTELTLKVLEKQIGLLRCHKQYLINLAHVAEIITLENGLAEIVTLSNHKLPVSRRYLRSLKEAFHL
ncbi:two component transcriptional regulator, LytTR family [Malonomonas rubra DSM 5091]|uniref:Two component transcriptional regulator, LytTR family n=1 Tax=Malonomonas rubra DSM 5091 TaxID=1122189 RepID=A0A1M6I8X7_MALRU|nr:two-component system response regulator BtsR [Malonomonas rubra]SHJ30920.1 two component transcriptional regulator, LytTR family [Malonomonas rubra DSM 5091]